jgi:hypothetical protein
LDSDRIAELIESGNTGDFTSKRSWFADTFQLHIPTWGINYSTADEALPGLSQLFHDNEIAQTTSRVEEHGVFVISFNTVTSNTRREPIETVNVYRLEGDLVAEGWVLSPPAG